MVDDDDRVGYKKPPKASQFQKGQSGNPKGRPKGSQNLATILTRVGRESVTMTGPAGTQTTTKNEAMMQKLANMALKGDLGAMRTFVSLVQTAEAQAAMERTTAITLDDMSAGAMKSLVMRMRLIHSNTTEIVGETNL